MVLVVALTRRDRPEMPDFMCHFCTVRSESSTGQFQAWNFLFSACSHYIVHCNYVYYTHHIFFTLDSNSSCVLQTWFDVAEGSLYTIFVIGKFDCMCCHIELPGTKIV